MDSEGIESYDLLAKHHWYKPQRLQIGYPTSREMRQEANLALGSWYRHRAWIEEKESYVELINMLANSPDSQEREIAFFLIRHTKSTEGRRGVHVDRVFHPVLRKLFMDTKLQKLTESYFEDFQANLEDINQLVRQHRPNTTDYRAPLNRNRRLELAMNHVRKNGFINTAEYRKLTGVSEDVALQDLGLLVTQGSLRRSGKKRDQGYTLP